MFLFQILASRGRQIAVTLIESHDFISRIMSYVSLEPTEVSMPLAEVLSLCQEAYHLWSIFLSYGLAKSQQAFSTFYPYFIKQLIFYRDKVDLNNNIESNQFNYEIGAHMINVLTKGLCVAATKTLLTNRVKNNEPSVESADGREIVLQPPTLDWEEFGEILSLIEICLTKWVNQLCSDVSFSGYKLLGSCCSFINDYLLKWRDQISFEGVVFSQKVEFFTTKIFAFLLQDGVRNFLLKRLKEHSALCSSYNLGKSRDPINLASLWSVCEGGKLTPILQKESPFPFLFPLTCLMKTMLTLHPGLDSRTISTVLNSEHLESYFLGICSNNHSLSSQWFTRIEIYCIANVLQLTSRVNCQNYTLYHLTALTILPHVHKGDEHIVKSLLEDVICNVDFVKDLAEVETQIDALTVKEYKPLKSPTISQPIISPLELTRKLYECLPSVGQNMIKNLLQSDHLKESLQKNACIPFFLNELTVDRKEMVSVLDHYWCLTPLKLLLHLNDSKGESSIQSTSEENILSVVRWLQMTFLLLRYRASVTLTHTTHTGWLRHLSNVYLVSNDIFLDVNVNSYNQACLISILDSNKYKKLSCQETFEGFQTCYDWYRRMIEQFSAISYGDSSFAIFIIVPLLRSWPSDFKLLLFGEHSETLPFIRLTPEDVSQFIPIQSFWDPPEEDRNVIIKYKMALGQQLVTEKRTPFLYHFVTYHIKKYQEANKFRIK